ncbi:hypothetical protein MF271_12635 [Deinococcus sp. KNUC1210]|uniref:hypothetical protein n=1 Tax=Deinococcus sp. KNUC1210 TaxID=2917691 RepID=UPI001EF15773|nr:hypothetical protein [Deinococcus sp. KNUC1210]ULH14822.1 hypothetical protein MF271_12635 [Deinococcus sp. KNUC1210]
MEELLTRALLGSEWQGEAGRDYASFILGFSVSALADLTEEEAKTVYRAAKVLRITPELTGTDARP